MQKDSIQMPEGGECLIEIVPNNRPHEVLGWLTPLDFIDEILN